MKKLFVMAIAFMVVGFFYLAISNSEQGNGNLTQETAENWVQGTYKCGSSGKVTPVEEGFVVSCEQDFQGMPGVFSKEFLLTYAADPAKDFHIDLY